jgi:hypothetical protein
MLLSKLFEAGLPQRAGEVAKGNVEHRCRLVGLELWVHALQIVRAAIREARFLAAVSHCNLVSLKEAYRSGSGRVYLVMEYCEHTLGGWKCVGVAALQQRSRCQCHDCTDWFGKVTTAIAVTLSMPCTCRPADTPVPQGPTQCRSAQHHLPDLAGVCMCPAGAAENTPHQHSCLHD